jgi:hypothetical protein
MREGNVMGELRWLAHGPEDVNHEARARVKDLTRYDSDHPQTLLNHDITTIHVSNGSALTFFIGMAALLVATWMIF